MRPSGSSTRADSTLPLRVLGVPAEIDADKRLVTDHPGVMAGADRQKSPAPTSPSVPSFITTCIFPLIP